MERFVHRMTCVEWDMWNNCSHTVTFCFVLNVYCLQIKKRNWYCVHLKPQKPTCAETNWHGLHQKTAPPQKKKLISIWDFWLPHNTVIVFIMTIWFITLPWGMQSSIASSRSQARTKEDGWDGRWYCSAEMICCVLSNWLSRVIWFVCCE